MPLSENNIPSALSFLIPLAEKWGIGDDYERENAIRRARRQELEELVHCIDSVSDDDLFGWLSGPQSYDLNPSEEYVAISCLIMSIDSAKKILKE